MATANLLPPLKNDGAVNWDEVIRMAFGSLVANKVRSALTMLGVIIGVASVVALIALGDGASASITGQITAIGTNTLTIAPGSPSKRGPGSTGVAQTLTFDDAKAIDQLGLPLRASAPQFSANLQIIAPAADKSASVIGTTTGYQTINDLTMARGVFFSDADVKNGAAVVVLGNTLAKDLFGAGQAVGQNVRMRDQSYRVIGVLAVKGSSGFGSVDDRALVPLATAHQRFPNTRTPDGNAYIVSSVTVAVKNKDDLAAVESRITTLMRERHQLKANGSEDDFQILNQAALLGTLTTITNLLTVFLAAVAGISLVVGGIGIMNIMLVSVTERTREIGLRKAVGAQSQDILMQFIFEAIVLSLVGGLIGLGLGGAIALLVTLSGALSASVSFSAAALALSFSIAVGLFFGIYPAQRAAQLNPIDALRYE